MAQNRSQPDQPLPSLTPRIAQAAIHPDIEELTQQDLTEQDMQDIQALLDQEQDLTQQDMDVKQFQAALNAYSEDGDISSPTEEPTRPLAPANRRSPR